MEFFDILNSSGEKTGKTKLRAYVHKDGDWHNAVDIWILNSKGELLLQKRSNEKESYPNLWEVSCSGHISAGDESLNSAIRELEEELGIKVTEKELTHIFSVKESHSTNNGTFINNEFKDVYLIEKDIPLNNFKLQKEEVSEIKFIHFTELKKLLWSSKEDFVPHDEEYKKLFELVSGVRQRSK